MTTFTDTQQEQIADALHYLAGVCDGAIRQDGHGFNKFDAPFGEDLASRTHLTDAQLAAAYRMIKKYHRQFDAAAIPFPTIEADEIENIRTAAKVARANTERIASTRPIPTITLDENAGWIYIYFYGRPAPDNLEKVRGITGRTWMPEKEHSPWGVPTASAEQVAAAWPEVTPPEIINLRPAPEATPQPAAAEGMRFELEDDAKTIAVTFPYSAMLVAKIKTLPQKMPVYKDGKFSHWGINREQLPTLLQMFPDAAVDSALEADVEKIKKRISLSRQSNGSTFKVDGLHGTLYDFQTVGVEFGVNSDGRFLCADDMGLGKTMIAIAIAQHYKDARPAVIVVPNSVKINWEREIAKWVDGEKIVKPTGRKVTPLRAGTIYLINWDILTYWVDALIALKPEIVIFDEAHYMKNKGSASKPIKRTAAGKKLSEATEKVIMLTGTPVTNRPKELFPLLNMLYPKAWPSFWQFAKRYCGAHDTGWGWDFDGATHLKELHERTAGYIIRRTKEQVLTELPPKRRATVVVEFDGKLREEYLEGIAAAVAAAESNDAGAQLVYIEKAKQVTARAKLKASIDWIRTMSELEKLVVFVHHHFVANAIAEALGDSAVIATGQQNAPQKQDAIDRFQSDPAVRVIIASKALQEGVTLTASSNVVFLEYQWTPGDQEQMEDRTHRIGQDRAVTIWNLVARGSIDEYIVKLLDEKRKVIDIIHDGKDSGQEFSITGRLLKELKKDLAAATSAH